jgi:hypothetical protein
LRTGRMHMRRASLCGLARWGGADFFRLGPGGYFLEDDLCR